MTAGKSTGMFGEDPKADQPAPTLAKGRDVLGIQGPDESSNGVHVELIRVAVAAGQLVRSAESDQIGSDTAMTRAGEHGNHLAVEVTPGGLAMHEQDGVGVARSLVQVVKAIAVHLDVMGLEGKVRQILEAIVRGAQDAGLDFVYGRAWFIHDVRPS